MGATREGGIGREWEGERERVLYCGRDGVYLYADMFIVRKVK